MAYLLDPPPGRSPLTRRGFLQLAALGSLGAAVAACAPSPTGGAPAAKPPAKPAASGAPAAPASAATGEWERVLAAAKQEGRLVLAGPPGDLYRNALVAFEKAYPDIKVEFSGGSGRDLAPRLMAEREAGQYLVDVHVGGPETANSQFKPRGVLDPIKPAIIAPDILDDARWVSGFDAGFMDKEGQYIYGFQGYIAPIVHVNRDVVPESELSRMEQLADPRWRGKISWNDPRVPGYGSANAGHLLMVLGEDWLRRAYQQDVTVVVDLRQQVEWMVRGQYPIGVGIDETHLEAYRAQGLGQNVRPLDYGSEAGQRMSPAWGNAMLVNRAPHPNAARVYLNWLLSKEGQTTWVQVTAQNSRRVDVEGPPATAPDQKAKYRIVNHEDYNHYISEAQAAARDIFK